MTEIKIKRLRLENFKCHQSLTLDFMGGSASIYGDNASGKTSIYDALTWLLFGKDSQGNGEKNIEIKPLDTNGQVKDHLAVTAVEAILLVNGEEVILRRTYKEVWSTKRGSNEATYDGNTSEYYVDGVPCKKNVFQDRVNELVDEETFRILTNVSHFANGISWQERRAVLFRVAGVMNDRQIMETREDFKPLLDGCGRLSLDDYKKKLLAEKRGFVGAKTEIPARISECQKTIEDIRHLDFAAAKAELTTLETKRDEIASQILAIDHDSAVDQKRMEIREAQIERDNLDIQNREYRASQSTGAVDAAGLKFRLTSLENRLGNKRMLLESTERSLGEYDKQVALIRERWFSVNGETFAGEHCPTCGQILPTEQLRAAAEAFEHGKQSRLREIEQTANIQKAAKAQAEARICELQEELDQIKAEMVDVREQITAAENVTIAVVDMDGYAEHRAAIQSKIQALSGELADMMQNANSVKENLRAGLAEIKAQIIQKRDICSKESLLVYSRKRVEELRQEAKNAAECLEAIEKMLFLIDEYSRYKTQFVEDSINGLFRIARFRLFREQANGGVEDRCDVVYDGVPYISVNNGMKINLGIDIINTLSHAYGVRVPLFVDNAESVTQLEKCSSQIVRLVVSEADKELRVNYEN